MELPNTQIDNDIGQYTSANRKKANTYTQVRFREK